MKVRLDPISFQIVLAYAKQNSMTVPQILSKLADLFVDELDAGRDPLKTLK